MEFVSASGILLCRAQSCTVVVAHDVALAGLHFEVFFYPEICRRLLVSVICKSRQPISFHNMKVTTIGRHPPEILTIVKSVNII